jgi:hypothetical protein
VISHTASIITRYHHRREPEMGKDIIRPSKGRSTLAELWLASSGQRGPATVFHKPERGVSTVLIRQFEQLFPRRAPCRRESTTAMPLFVPRHAPSSREKTSCTPNIKKIAQINQAAVKRMLSQIQVQTKEGPHGTRLLRCAWTTGSEGNASPTCFRLKTARQIHRRQMRFFTVFVSQSRPCRGPHQPSLSGGKR